MTAIQRVEFYADGPFVADIAGHLSLYHGGTIRATHLWMGDIRIGSVPEQVLATA